MSSFANADLRLDLPEGWIDRSMLVWSAPPGEGGGTPPNVVISYDQMKVGEQLAGYVTRQTDSLRAALDQWTLIEQGATRVGGKPAIAVRFTWRMAHGLMMQRQIFVELGKLRIASIGCTAGSENFDACDRRWFAPILDSIRLKE
ncbi:DcrB-related protein [Paracoccus pacificus]|uniref:DcrB-related protein n=1 Tax=Paracoccus pacificus TaxID=1463598 RepID=A0ABW4R583_9RHOB